MYEHVPVRVRVDYPYDDVPVVRHIDAASFRVALVPDNSVVTGSNATEH